MFYNLYTLSVQLFDTDEDEKITRQEFTALLRSALGVSDLNMVKLFKEIDADGSGFITFSKCFTIQFVEQSKKKSWQLFEPLTLISFIR